MIFSEAAQLWAAEVPIHKTRVPFLLSGPWDLNDKHSGCVFCLLSLSPGLARQGVGEGTALGVLGKGI